MNFTTKKLKKKVPNSSEKSFQEKAFTRVRAGERSHGVYTKQDRGVSTIAEASLPNTCLGKLNAPLGYEDGLFTRIRILEGIIHDKTLKGDSEGLRRALKEYALTWIELKRGVLCKK